MVIYLADALFDEGEIDVDGIASLLYVVCMFQVQAGTVCFVQ